MAPRELQLNAKIMLDACRIRLSSGKSNQVGDWVGSSYEVARYLENAGVIRLHSPVQHERGILYSIELM